jgi:hypothetical protein
MRTHNLLAASAVLSVVVAEFGAIKRRDFGIDWNEADFSKEGVFSLGEPATFLETVRGVEKNETQPHLQDRSAELFARQQCDAGYGYCSSESFFRANGSSAH